MSLYYFSIYCSTRFECSYILLQELATYCGFISCVVLLWFDVCWCYGVVRLGWCGILMQAEAKLKSDNKSQAPEEECTNIRNMLSSK